jgi:hypothetical protein
MNTCESFRALRRANPRAKDGLALSVEAVRAQVEGMRYEAPLPGRRPLGRLAIATSLTAAAVVAGALMLGSRGAGVENATAAVRRAATTTAASAERSGTAVVRINHESRLWAGSTVRWHGGELAVTQDAPDRRGKVGSQSLLVGGTIYGIDPERGDWVDLGSPKNIDPESGTTPGDVLAAIREDIGGVTLRRITGGMTAASTSHRADGSTVYSGKVAAGLIATESGYKEGQAIRVFPFGYVAHDEAADPDALLDTAVTVGTGGVVRQIAVTWGSWSYTVTYRGLGTTPAPVAPENARSLLKERLRAANGSRPRPTSARRGSK